MLNVERDPQIVAYYIAGHTFKQCAEAFGISLERARQIVTRAQRRLPEGADYILRGPSRSKYPPGSGRLRKLPREGKVT